MQIILHRIQEQNYKSCRLGLASQQGLHKIQKLSRELSKTIVFLQIIVGEEILLVPTFRKHIVATKDGTSYLYVHRVIIEQTPLT